MPLARQTPQTPPAPSRRRVSIPSSRRNIPRQLYRPQKAMEFPPVFSQDGPIYTLSLYWPPLIGRDRVCSTKVFRMTCGRSVAGPMDHDAFSGVCGRVCVVWKRHRLGRSLRAVVRLDLRHGILRSRWPPTRRGLQSAEAPDDVTIRKALQDPMNNAARPTYQKQGTIHELIRSPPFYLTPPPLLFSIHITAMRERQHHRSTITQRRPRLVCTKARGGSPLCDVPSLPLFIPG